MWSSQLRESEDEEMIADIVASILLIEPFARSKEALDELYQTKSATYQKVEGALLTYSIDKMYDEIKQVFSVIRETIEDFDNGPNTLRNVVSPGSRNPIKSSFYAIFMAFYELLELSENPKLNEDLLKRIVNTACGIANLGPRSEGFIYIGVADKLQDAERIKKIYGTEYIIISDHYVVGIDREAKKLNFNIEKYIKMIVDYLRGSELSDQGKKLIAVNDLFTK